MIRFPLQRTRDETQRDWRHIELVAHNSVGSMQTAIQQRLIDKEVLSEFRT